MLEDVRYYGQAAPVAGHFKGLSSEGEGLFAKLKVSGTRNEELLRVLSGRKDKVVHVHLCEEGCTGQLSDEMLLHASGFEDTELNRVPWLTNLQGMREEDEMPDELADLRREQERMEKDSKEVHKKMEKKEKKRRRKPGEQEGRCPKSPKKENGELDENQWRTSSKTPAWIQNPRGEPEY